MCQLGSESKIYSDLHMAAPKAQEALDVKIAKHNSFEEQFITLRPQVGQNPTEMFNLLASYIQKHNLHVVAQFVFGNCEHKNDISAVINQDIPISWIHGDAATGREIEGIQVYATRGMDVEPVYLDGKVVGSTYESEIAEFCFLSGIHPKDSNASKEAQTSEMFERMHRALESIGMGFSNVVRTWLYLEDLLSWYEEFNSSRSAFFDEHGIFESGVPASTGIGARNSYNALLLGNAFAIRPKSDGVKIKEVISPLQCSALDYKSSFSRAMELSYPTHRQLIISGTASIEPNGKTAHPDNIDKQIALTMDVVLEILHSRDMDITDTTRGIAYFKAPEYIDNFNDFLTRKNLPLLPISYMHADICRENLLFEIEIDAIKT